MICSELFTPPTISFAERLLFSPCRSVLYNTCRLISNEQKESFHFKKLTNRLSMAALASVEYWCSDLRWCYLQQTSICFCFFFFRSDPHAVVAVSTARSPNILWRLWSHKPLHKHDSNKYQSKAFVICDHKSDETRSVTLVNEAYLVWLMFRVLSNQHYPHRANQKLRSWANAVFQNRGVCVQAFPSFPSSSAVISFFFSLFPTFSTN